MGGERESEINVKNGDENGEKCHASDSGREMDGIEHFCPLILRYHELMLTMLSPPTGSEVTVVSDLSN
ncbi:Hypothetical protein SMAX5B_001756 [Scophthalmus maximus]|uniref:Uncharacterized protein n=1 Tax=Scophthalmus maximus TaxID=52904 RepID=A0A2U9CWH0_SCOMX|nr:Hypothetical protein SMAX5B_001756 [Scophthalmus maximus]